MSAHRYRFALVRMNPALGSDALSHYISKAISRTFGLTASIHFTVLAVLQEDPKTDEANAIIKVAKRDAKTLLGAIATFMSPTVSIRLVEDAPSLTGLSLDAVGIVDQISDDEQ